jgi:hypothetical protein
MRMIGVILGSAFDRAIGLTLRHWRVVVGAWVVLGLAFIFDQTPTLVVVSLLSLVWLPIPAILAGHSVSSEFSIRATSLLRFYAVSLLWFTATVGLLATFAAILIPNYLHARESGSSGSVSALGIIAAILGGVAVSVWIGNKWSLAPTVALYRSRPIAASFRESWALTTGRFWQTLAFNVAASLAYVLVWYGPIVVTAAVIGIAYNADAEKVSQFTSHFVPALFIPLLAYDGIAEWVAYFRWLEWLESVRVTVPRDAS